MVGLNIEITKSILRLLYNKSLNYCIISKEAIIYTTSYISKKINRKHITCTRHLNVLQERDYVTTDLKSNRNDWNITKDGRDFLQTLLEEENETRG